MRCQNCGTELQPNEQFCYRCGQAIEQEIEKRYCVWCGAELEPDAAFCWKCGNTTDETSRPAEQPEELRQEETPVQAQPHPSGPSIAPIAEEPAAKHSEPDEQSALKARTETLVLAAQSGNSESFTELYQLYYQKVFALAKTTVKSDADAEDVLQMTFLKAWNNLAKLKNTAAFSTWIQRITLNQCYSLLRKKKIDVSIDSDDEGAEPIQIESDLMLPEVYAERSDLKTRLGKIIHELSSVQQQTITLYYFDELPVENIAWIMDCSVNTVKSRLFLARKSIKTEIEEQERKSGQPFYGAVGLGLVPFSKLFLGQMESSALSQTAASAVLETITQKITESTTGTIGQATAKAAGTVTKNATKTVAGTTVKTGAGVASKTVTAAVTKKIIAGIVAGILATGAITGGTVAAVSAVQKHRGQAVQMDIAATGNPDAWDFFANPDSANKTAQSGTANRLSATERMAYQAYIKLLQEKKAALDAYTWQKNLTEEEASKNERLSRPVAVRDIDGDGLVELLLCLPDEPIEQYGDVRLHIFDWVDNAVKTVYTDNDEHVFWVGEHDYTYCQLKENDSLYLLYRYADIDYDAAQCEWYRYAATNNGYYSIERVPDDQRPSESLIAVELMSTQAPSETSAAMTADEAITYLKGLLNASNGAEKQPGATAYADACAAYLDYLIAHKEGIDNYLWQIGGWESYYDVEEGTDLFVLLDEPLTDDERIVTRPVVFYDIYGDAIPEMIYIGDVASPVKFTSVSTLNVLTYQNGQLVPLFSGEWDHPEWEDFVSADSLLVRPDGTLVYYHSEGATFDSQDYYEVFLMAEDGMLHREFALEYFYEEWEDSPEIVENYYGRGRKLISKEEYEAQLKVVVPEDCVLLFDRYGYANFAMTADEAIAYLEKQLDLDRAAALDDLPVNNSYFTTTFTSSSGKIGTASVRLKKGFDFLETDSSQLNYELALTAITLSAQVYKSAQGKKTEEILYALGYEKTSFSNGDSSFAHPGVCFGYKQIEKGKNLFTAVVRGTDTTNGLTDVWTDLQDGALAMFEVSGKYIEIQLEEFMEKATGKTQDALLQEDNYFFFAGHSLGGAVANYLSINKNVMEFVGSDKGKIYTYTFESPHTCVNLWWKNPESESNAYNYKVDGDAVTNLPPYIGSTTYGKDVWIKVSELNDNLFCRLFPESESKTLASATSVSGHGDSFGLHDVCLDLVYIVDASGNTGYPEGMPISFWHGSGVGAWGEEILFQDDGTITGVFHDWDGGWDGPGYDATMQYSSYTCRIDNMKQINSYTYTFIVTDVIYDHAIDKEEIIKTADGERTNYIYTTGSFTKGTQVTLYTDKAPVSAIPPDAIELYEIATAQQITGTMPCYVLYCSQTNASFFSDE